MVRAPASLVVLALLLAGCESPPPGEERKVDVASFREVQFVPRITFDGMCRTADVQTCIVTSVDPEVVGLTDLAAQLGGAVAPLTTSRVLPAPVYDALFSPCCLRRVLLRVTLNGQLLHEILAERAGPAEGADGISETD
jgi:hypothetical protein